MGGFITAAARLARSNIRPLLLPPASNPSASPSLLKRIYDLLGIVLTSAILNYTACPFILLTVRDSFLTWGQLGWYGHVIVMGSLVFFYAGGTKFFMDLQKAKGILPPSKGPASVQNGTSTPLSEKTFTFPPSVDTVIPPRWLKFSKTKNYGLLRVSTTYTLYCYPAFMVSLIDAVLVLRLRILCPTYSSRFKFVLWSQTRQAHDVGKIVCICENVKRHKP